MSDVTRILHALDAGDPRAASDLLPAVYDELRTLAAQRLSLERPGQTLQATALVHEAYLRLTGNGESPPGWQNTAHFFAAAAEAMRRILVEQARRKARIKHGGGRHRMDVDELNLAADTDTFDAHDLLDLDEALAKLAELDSAKAELVKLRYFAGLSLDQAAKVLDISPATADRHWAFARAWLYQAIHGQG
jgi:RNA polymerase sigma factor (TIGR02999 family)